MARFVSTGLHVRARTLRCRRICRSWRRIRPRSRPGVRFVAVRITSVLPSGRNARSTTSSSASSLRSRTSTSFFSIPSPRTGSTSRAFARLLPSHRRPTSPTVPWLSSKHVRFVSSFETNAKHVRSSDRSRKRDGNDRRDRASLHLSIQEATGEPISLPNRRCTVEISPRNGRDDPRSAVRASSGPRGYRPPFWSRWTRGCSAGANGSHSRHSMVFARRRHRGWFFIHSFLAGAVAITRG